MTEFENYLHQAFEISHDLCKIIAASFKSENFKKGDYLVEAGFPSNRLSYIQQGVVRVYIKLPEKEVTQWVNTRQSFTTDFSAFFYQQPSLRYIQALTDTHLLSITYDDFHELGNSLPAFKEFERYFISKCYLFMESRVVDLITLSAKERYEQLFNYNRELLNQVSLHYLASMLGMTAETFSRVRKKISS